MSSNNYTGDNLSAGNNDTCDNLAPKATTLAIIYRRCYETLATKSACLHLEVDIKEKFVKWVETATLNSKISCQTPFKALASCASR